MLVKAQCCLQQPHHLVDFREPDTKIELPDLQSASTAAPPECKAPLSNVQHVGGEIVSKLLPQNNLIHRFIIHISTNMNEPLMRI